SQTSKQDNDQGSGSTQTNTVKGDCSTPGNCTDNQTTTVNGQTTTNTQTGQNVNAQTTCSGSDCTTTTVGSGDIFVSVGHGLVQEWTPSGALVRTLDTGKSANPTGITTGLAIRQSDNMSVTG